MKAKDIAKPTKYRFVQQVHQSCGGWIVVAAHKKTMGFVCLRCHTLWGLESTTSGMRPLVPTEWEDTTSAVDFNVLRKT